MAPRLKTTFISFSLFPTVSHCGPFFSHSPAAPLSDTTSCHLLSPPLVLLPLMSVALWLSLPSSVQFPAHEDDSLAISGENVVNPGQQGADFGVNAWIVRQSAALAPGDDTMQLPVAHQRAARVTLSMVEEKGSVHDPIPLVVVELFTFYLGLR